ncbi:uncharacterized protein LOC141704252 [Apium graveolens]|uniref:uncharacterized protein LOC141704252 n=1 Tax=Apium graveolens TaxID=4045 RepID=UPI003D7985E8
MTGNRVTLQDLVNPLYLHPSDGAVHVEKLQASTDYRAWKMAMKINVTSKRKLAFVTGGVARPSDLVQAKLWDTCNNMIIAWLTHNVSPSIIKSMMFMTTTASPIRSNLETRFQLTNGFRKYKINIVVHDLKQGTLSINEYYTDMRALWEELESLNTLPTVVTPSEDVTVLLNAISSQKEEASAALHQEEAQRELLQLNKLDNESVAIFTKSNVIKYDKPMICTVCGGRGHKNDKCWDVVGYVKWHAKHGQISSNNSVRVKPQFQTNKWPSGHNPGVSKMATTAQPSLA